MHRREHFSQFVRSAFCVVFVYTYKVRFHMFVQRCTCEGPGRGIANAIVQLVTADFQLEDTKGCFSDVSRRLFELLRRSLASLWADRSGPC